jgi:FkbM family methyltransferase
MPRAGFELLCLLSQPPADDGPLTAWHPLLQHLDPDDGHPMTLKFLQAENHTICRSFLGPDSAILDLGGNKGLFVRAMRETFGCECFTVEPNPELYVKLQSLPLVHALNYAVSGARGDAVFNVDPNNEASSLLANARGDERHTINVKTIDLVGLLEETKSSHIDLLKVDIEGAEIAMFDAMPDSLASSFGQITVEFHDFCGVPVADIERIMDRFRRLGFCAIKFSKRTYGDVWFLNTRIHPISQLDFSYAKFIYRNATGVKRVLARSLSARAP